MIQSARQLLTAVFEPPGPRGKRYTALALIGLGLVLAVLYARQLGEPWFPVDDAYISLHNAEVLVTSGPDQQFVGTPALVGSTSAVHVVLIALFTLVMPSLWAAFTVMALGAIAYVLATLRLAFVLRASIPEALLMIAASLVLAQMPHTLANGLETSWALAGVTYAIAAARDRGARAWELPVVCGLLPFLRPELVVVSGLLMAVRVLGELRKQGLSVALRTAGYFAAAALPFMVLYLLTTGVPYPNTIEAKRNFFAEGCQDPERRLEVIKSLFIAFRDSIGIYTYAAVLLMLTVTGWTGLLFTAVFAYAYYERFPGALGHYEQRYMYVLIPWLTYGAAQLIAYRHVVARVLAAALFACCIWQASDQFLPRWQFHLACIGFTQHELDPVASWLDANVHGRKILLHDAGYVGFFVDAPMADLVGLKTPASIPSHRELTWAECSFPARTKAIEQIAMREQPDYLVVLKGWDWIFQISAGLRANGWTLEPRYEHEYIVFEVTGRPPKPPAQ